MRKKGNAGSPRSERKGRPSESSAMASRNQLALLGKILKNAMAVVLAASLFPLLPAVVGTDAAWAAVGTTDYDKYFNRYDKTGTPTRPVTNGVLRVASTELTSDWGAGADALIKRSDGCFVSKTPVSLKHDWTLRFTGQVPNPVRVSGMNQMNMALVAGLSSSSSPASSNSVQLNLKKRNLSASKGNESVMQATSPTMSSAEALAAELPIVWTGTSASAVLTYDCSADTLTLSMAGYSHKYSPVKKGFGGASRDSAYLYFGGQIVWQGVSGAIAPPSRNLTVQAAFTNMELPHFDPTIQEIKIYNGNSATPLGTSDTIPEGTIVRVECIVKNTNTGSSGEQFPVHLSMLGGAHATYPTVGLTPIRNSTYPTKVNGSIVGYDINGSGGVPLTLNGTSEVKVSYYARVSQANGAAVKLGLQLMDDSFSSTVAAGATLLAEKQLKPLPDNGSGTAGKDYHYSRSPQANANGWNTSPVTLTFFPGDFDQLSLTPGGGAASTLTGAAAEWVRRDDTSGLTVALKATNSSTGAASTAGSESIKIDTAKPSLSVDPALGVLTINDKSADASKATSGVWRLYRTGADGTIAARAAAKTFPLTNGAGAATQTVSNPTNGYYVAEDAAGNVSDVFKVGATEPPTVSRPAGSIVDPSDPNPPTPVGPPIGPGDAVPTPTVSEDDIGLKHAVINETITQFVDAANPAFGGSLTLDGAKALMAYRYEATPSAAPATTTVELLDTLGAPLASLPTTAVGECLIRQVTTDAQGNTTTINLTYRLIKDNCPVVRPWQPADPDDPTGPKVPGEALEPDGPVTTKPDGTQHAMVSCEATEVVRKGTMGTDGAAELLKRHFALASFDGKDAAVRTVSLATAAGAAVDSIDLSAPGDYLITYEATDADGNSTTVKLTYHLVPSRAPGTTAHPDPGTNPNPQPGDDPLNPKPYPLEPTDPPRIDADGTHHATVRDEMVVPVQEGASLSLTDVRDLMGRRYAFAPVAGGSTTERALEIARADGSAADSVDLSQPGEYVIRYEVADGEGNSTTVLLTCRVQAAEPTPPEVPDDPSGPDEPTLPEEPEAPVPPTVVVKPGEGADGPGGGGLPDTKPRPLPPTSVTVDPETGLSHAVIRDTLTVGTSGTPATAESLAALFAKRYEITSSQPDGELTREPVALFDAAGGPVEAIDRSQPGDWRADQVVADSAGNTTTIQVTYLVREGSVGGGVTDDGNGAGSVAGSGDGSGGDGAGSDDGGDGRWTSLLTRLPQTGDLLTRCPVHIMFVLLMVLASAYGLARLRQEAARERDRRQRALEELWDAELQRPGGGMWS